ncbi:hypothetical protein ACFRCG_39795 [Embleya sp. NPDC056575]|uniref:hypothetical protein n=1 Tax=unclassified Embleya TaxID=2699296 RepID=UPI0036877F32
MPPAQPDHRPRLRVTLPDDQGVIVARLMWWIQREHGGWEAVVAWNRWAATHPADRAGPVVTQAMGDVMSVPRAAVEPIRGEDYSRVERKVETPMYRRSQPRDEPSRPGLGERVDRMRRG